MGDGVQLARGVARQVRARGPGLAQQPLRVLVGAPLPGAVGIGKEPSNRQPLGQAVVLGPRFPPSIGQGLAQQRGPRPACLGEARAGPPRLRSGHPGQTDQASRPLP
jgi:hypothetical protein